MGTLQGGGQHGGGPEGGGGGLAAFISEIEKKKITDNSRIKKIFFCMEIVYLKTKVAKYFKEKHRVEHDLLKKYKQ